MSTFDKNSRTESTNSREPKNKRPAAEVSKQLSPRLVQARQQIERLEYQRAIDLLSASNCDLEERNTCAVCLMRLHRFEEAIELLRPVCLRSNVNMPREGVPLHILINFATALYFGGRPAGALEFMHELKSDSHPAVKMVFEHSRHWVAQMPFFRRWDWRLNRVAPKQPPTPPTGEVGICIWET